MSFFFCVVRVHLIIRNGSTVMLTCMCTALSSSHFLIDSRLSSAAGQVGAFCEPGTFSPVFIIHLSVGNIFALFIGCDAFFKIKYRLREHLRSHTQERLVACPTCGCMFSSNTKFFDHIQRQAEPEGLFILHHSFSIVDSDCPLKVFSYYNTGLLAVVVP